MPITNYDGKFAKIRKQFQNTAFDNFYQAGTANKFHLMNIIAESKALNKIYWICVDEGYRSKEVFSISVRDLSNSNAKSTRTYFKNQTEVCDYLKEISKLITEATL